MFAGGVAAALILAALLVGALRLVLAHVPAYQDEIAARVRTATGMTLRFDGLDARLGLRGPEIFFDAARVLSADGGRVLLSARAGRVRIAVIRSLLHRRLEIGRLTLDGPRLGAVISADGRVELVGLEELLRPDPARGPFNLARLPQGSFEIRDARIDVQDRRAGAVPRLSLDGLDVELERSSRAVRVRGKLDLPRQLGSSITWKARASGDLSGWRALDWRVSADLGRIDFSRWRAHLPVVPGLPVAGRGDLRLSLRGQGTRPRQGLLDIDFSDLAASVPPGRPPVQYRHLAARAVLGAAGNGWSVELERLLLQRPARDAEPLKLRIDGAYRNGQLSDLALQGRLLRLEDLLPLVAFMPQAPLQDRLLALAPRGTLRDTDLTLSRRGNGSPMLHGRLRAEGLGFEPVGRAPGVEGLDATITASGTSGRVQIDTTRFSYLWPHDLRERIAARRLSAVAGWEQHALGWRLWADDLVLDLDDATVRARLRMLFPDEGDSGPLIDLAARVSDGRVASTPRYLPVSKFRPSALKWLDAAFRAGRARDATLTLTGPLRRYPFRDGGGLFRVDARIEGLALHYVDGWPPAEDLNIDARFENTGLRARIASGRVGQVAIENGEVTVIDWRDGGLTARLPAAGDLADALGLLQQSPLGPRLGELFMGLSGRGGVQGEVLLDLPLKHMDDRVITVAVRPESAELREAGVAEPLTKLSGTFVVRNGAMFAPRIDGELLGGPVRITVDTPEVTPARRRVTVQATGTLQGERLQRLAGLPERAALSGETDWRGTVRIERTAPETSAHVTVRLDGDLVGLASGLPPPFDKEPADRRAIAIDIDLDRPGHLVATASHGGRTRAALAFERAARGWQIERGQVRFGPGPAPVTGDRPGLRLTGTLPRASLSSVLALRQAGASGRHVQDWLQSVDLDVERLEALGFVFEKVALRMQPQATAWRVQIDAPAARGRILVPFDFSGTEPLVLDLDHLRLGPTEARAGAAGEPPDPRDLPSIRFDVRDFAVDRWQFGHVTADLVRGADGLTAPSIEARHAAFEARGQGAWRMQGGRSRSSLTLDVSSEDLGRFMQTMGYNPVITGKQASVHAELHWPGMLDGSFFERMSGTIRLEAAEGSLIDVAPGGAGRMLGLMSIAHLPRRLALDFRDITSQGLAFDTIRGTFVVTSGDAYTDDLTLRGAAAEIGIVGHTDFRSHSYDQTAMVTGKLGASLGVAGALAGGPAVGAVMLVFSQVFKSPLKGMTRGYYRIAGTWEQPTVERIDAGQHRAARTDAAPAETDATTPAPLAQ